MKAKLSELEELLGYNFNNIGHLHEALIHTSYAHENNMKCSNERLELLGDAVIHLALTEFLLSTYPHENEGNLSSLRSYCESEPFLCERAKDIDLGKFILFGRGETLGGGQHKESLLSNAYEAVIAAIHIDGGFKKSTKLVLDHFSEHVLVAYNEKLYIDAKSELQKYSQKVFATLPTYTVINEEGEEHKKTFEVAVVLNEYSATGNGKTKKLAEKEAARKLLTTLEKSASK